VPLVLRVEEREQAEKREGEQGEYGGEGHSRDVQTSSSTTITKKVLINNETK
jgi:hypothetical protein